MSIDVTPPPAVVKFAKENGYDNAKYIGKWQDFKVYEPTFNNKEVHYVGYPLSILEKNNKIRFTTEKECFDVLDSLPQED